MNLEFVKELIEMDVDIIKDNTLIGSLTDVSFKISRPYKENDETYATFTVMQKSGDVELIAKIRVLTLKDISKSKENEVINI